MLAISVYLGYLWTSALVMDRVFHALVSITTATTIRQELSCFSQLWDDHSRSLWTLWGFFLCLGFEGRFLITSYFATLFKRSCCKFVYRLNNVCCVLRAHGTIFWDQLRMKQAYIASSQGTRYCACDHLVEKIMILIATTETKLNPIGC